MICLFGSSIGDTDSLWWKLIGNRLRENTKLIIFDRCQEISPRRAYKKARIERDKKEFFFGKTGVKDEDKQKVLNNIYVGLNTEMFKLIQD